MSSSILCVDDESTVLTSLKEQLKRTFEDQYTIEIAESGEEALEIVEEFVDSPETLPLVISDQIMPGIKGDELLIRIHKQLPNTLKILLTGQANAEAVGNAVNNANLYRFIAKPWEKQDLILTISEALKRFYQERELESKSRSLLENASTFYKFVPTEFLEQLGIDNDKYSQVRAGLSVEKELTVMFIDIRSFTTLCEMMPGGYIFQFLNDYLSFVSPIIYANRGFIDSYIGDAIMALFPSADDAVITGISILKALKQFNLERLDNGNVPIGIGIGINTGIMTLGTLGEPNRFQTTVIGDAVNTAARIESLTKDFQTGLLVSESTLNSVKNKDKIQFTQVTELSLKGKIKSTKVFDINMK